jgi:hypothetical protein
VQPSPYVVIYLPEAPALEVCPQKVIVEGDVAGDRISLSLTDAQKLRDWINKYIVCSESNQVKLKGYAEKLENRLKAVGGR